MAKIKLPVPSKPIPEGLAPIDQLAVKYGLCPVTIRRWGQAGKLEMFKVPGYGLKRFVRASDLAALMKPVSVKKPSLAD